MQDLVAFYRELDPELRAFMVQGARILIILIGAWILQALARRLVRLFRLYMSRRSAGDQVARIETLARVFRNVAAVVIVVVAGMLVLGELGISIAPILATAGVAGIAVGFGAQSLIKDYFNGMFLLLDDQVRVGDVVEVGGKGGLVEEVTLRFVRLRDMEGHVHYVPNGEIKLVTNRTREFATPLIEVGIAYREDPDEAFRVMREVAAALRGDPAWAERIADDLEIIGVERLGEFLKRLKKAYDERGIEIPFPHLTIYPGQLKDGSAPPLQIALEKRGP
jgi:moderate conductance mechanosensitive channel